MGSGQNSESDKPSEESLRLLLQTTLERNDGLVKINTEATLAIPTIIGGLWGVLLGWNKFESVALSSFTLITIGIFVIWRYYAHYIDDDVAKSYSRILQLEKDLKISKKTSIYYGLIKSIISPMRMEFGDDDDFRNYENSLLNLCKDQRIKLIELLRENKKMGYRGHNYWDFVGFFSILCCTSYLCYLLLTILNMTNILSFVKGLDLWLNFVVLIVLILLIIGKYSEFYGRFFHTFEFPVVHIHPTKQEMDGFITKAKILALIPEEDC